MQLQSVVFNSESVIVVMRTVLIRMMSEDFVGTHYTVESDKHVIIKIATDGSKLTR